MNRTNMLIDCEREVRRIDLLIWAKLNNEIKQVQSILTCNFVTKCECQQKIGRNPSMIDGEADGFQQLKNVLRFLQAKASTLRPTIYQPENHARHSRIAFTALIIIIAVLVGPNIITIPKMILRGAINSKCSKYIIENHLDSHTLKCNFRDVFSWQDILFAIEMLVASIAIGMNLFGIVLLVLDGVYTQVLSIKKIGKDLDICIGCLDNFHSISCTGYSKQTADQDSSFLNYKLIETFLKFTILEEDGNSNRNTIARTLNIYLITYGPCLGLSLVGGAMADQEKEIDMKFVQLFMMSWLLFQQNLVIFCCAHLQSEEMKLNRQIFSITSRLLIGGKYSHKNVIDSYVISNWMKLAQGRSMFRSINTIRLFGITTIDYEKLLGLNFVFLSLAALLKSL